MFLNFPITAATYSWCVASGAVVALLLLLPRTRELLLDSKWWWPLMGLLLLAGMFLLPSQNHLMGDGQTQLASAGRWFSPTEPLDFFLHQLLGKITGSMLISYRIIAWLGGAFYLIGIYLMSRLGKSPLERGLIILAFLSTATIQFYFGYVESYTLLNLFTLYFLYFSWRDLESEQHSKLPLLFFVLAVLSHFSGMALLPGLIYLYRKNLGRSFFIILGVLVVGAVAAAFLVDIKIILVPLTAGKFSAYTLFSSAHLSDIAQVLLLITPLGWLAIFSKRHDSPVLFALFALAGTLLFTILVDPKIGAFRDWDLLSVYALPLCLLLALRAPRHYLTLIALVLVIALRIAPWILFNSKMQVDFLKQVVAGDMHYTEQYDNGQRLSSWGFLLTSVGDNEAAEAIFEERLLYKPGDLHVLNMLVPVEFALGKYRKAYEYCLQALEYKPSDFDFRYRGMYCAFRMGDLDAAIRLGVNSPPEFYTSPHVKRLHAGVLALQGQNEEAIAEAKAVDQRDTDGYLPYILSHSAATIGDSLYARKEAVEATELDTLNETYKLWLDSLVHIDRQ